MDLIKKAQFSIPHGGVTIRKRTVSRAVIASSLNILAHFIYQHWRQLEIDGSWL